MQDDATQRLDVLEQKLDQLLDRVEQLERRLESAPARLTTPPARPVAPPRVVPPREPSLPRRSFDVEELLGGRVLGWAGGAAIVLGAVFFLVMAVSRGWIDEPTRVVLAFLASTALLAVSLWLYERKGQTQAALAAAAAALASLYASLTVG